MIAERQYLQAENDHVTDVLYETSLQIKQYSLMLREQAVQQNQRLDDMEKQMETADNHLRKTIYSMQHMTQYNWPWAVLLCLGVLIFWW